MAERTIRELFPATVEELDAVVALDREQVSLSARTWSCRRCDVAGGGVDAGPGRVASTMISVGMIGLVALLPQGTLGVEGLLAYALAFALAIGIGLTFMSESSECLTCARARRPGAPSHGPIKSAQNA